MVTDMAAKNVKEITGRTVFSSQQQHNFCLIHTNLSLFSVA